MNITEYLLTKLGEECNEVAQRVAKAQCFGLNEKQPGQEMTNADRINYELNDVAAVLVLLKRRGIFRYRADPAAQERKIRKLGDFMRYSRELGTLEAERGPDDAEEGDEETRG